MLFRSLGDGDDVLLLRATAAATTLIALGGNGNDAMTVGTQRSLSLIGGALQLRGEGGQDTLTFDDSDDSAANSGSLSATGVTGLGLGTTAAYETIETLALRLGSGADSLCVNSSNAATATSVDGGIGDDVLTVGDTAAGMRNVAGALSLQGGGGIDALVVDDRAGAQLTGVVNTGVVTGFGAAGISHGNIENIDISTSTVAQNILLQSTADGTRTRVLFGTGVNNVVLGSSGGAPTLNALAGAIVLVDGGGRNTILADDRGDTTANTGTLSSAALTGFGLGRLGVAFTGPLASLDLRLGSGTNVLALQSSPAGVTNVSGGSGADTPVLL